MVTTQRKVLVYGATGTQIGPIVPQLIKAGYRPYALTRSLEKAHNLQATGAQIVVGDLGDREGILKANQGMDIVALLIPFFINPADAPRFADNAI